MWLNRVWALEEGMDGLLGSYGTLLSGGFTVVVKRMGYRRLS